MPDETDYASRSGTERRGYEQLRQSGVDHTHARDAARRASEMAHRNADRRESDRQPPSRNRR
jgi:hypothetical protein